ncbi:MAG: sigma-70 family RNA polymerase sigma factor [Planctomycetes bacterium]|nr:sigma-70 family RNA polymerase sigma factor [Planctomycetota bacterium]
MSIRSAEENPAEFESLARRHAEMLSAYLRSLLGSSSQVDDLFQEVLVVAWRRFSDYDRMRPFDAWLRGIARFQVLENARKSGHCLACTDPHTLDLLDARYSAFSTLGSQSAFADQVDRLLTCLGALPQTMREVMELAYARGMMLKQIAAALSVEEETVKKRVQRTRSTLADCLRKQGALP